VINIAITLDDLDLHLTVPCYIMSSYFSPYATSVSRIINICVMSLAYFLHLCNLFV